IIMSLIGLSEPKDFASKIKESLKIDEPTAKNITSEINEQIFEKIREEMKKEKEEILSDEELEELTKTPIPVPEKEEIDEDVKTQSIEKNDIFKNAGIELVENSDSKLEAKNEEMMLQKMEEKIPEKNPIIINVIGSSNEDNIKLNQLATGSNPLIQKISSEINESTANIKQNAGGLIQNKMSEQVKSAKTENDYSVKNDTIKTEPQKREIDPYREQV
ncbi:MAG: hypothetical protein WDK96_04100, partial [Candidatus Paceibacterota bacterium]